MRFVLIVGMNDHPASWRMPTEKQMEKLASDRLKTVRSEDPGPDGPLPKEYWDEVLGPQGRWKALATHPADEAVRDSGPAAAGRMRSL